MFLLQKCELLDVVYGTQANPMTGPIDATYLVAFKKKNIKEKGRKMVIREKMKGIKITKVENVTSFLTRIT